MRNFSGGFGIFFLKNPSKLKKSQKGEVNPPLPEYAPARSQEGLVFSKKIWAVLSLRFKFFLGRQDPPGYATICTAHFESSLLISSNKSRNYFVCFIWVVIEQFSPTWLLCAILQTQILTNLKIPGTGENLLQFVVFSIFLE